MKGIVYKELERGYKKFIRSKILVNDFIAKDPVQFPRRFSKRADIEIAAFLAATIAWGRRDLIIRSAEKMFALMETSPSAFVQSGNYRKLKDRCIHRTFFEGDLKYFCKGFRHCYAKYGTLEKLFATAPDVWQGIALFREEMAAANGGRFSKHIANPGGGITSSGSACKRINLALRWLVREGPVDTGLWKSIKPAALYIPLDVHVARTARKLGLLTRKSNDRKAVVELTEKLRGFCKEDPVRYDYALFGMM
jgi:uncharacterized protein (TIGR02757 family)